MADVIAVSAAFVEGRVRDQVHGTLEDKARAAMVAALDRDVTFMLTSDDARFRAGLGALVLLTQSNADDLARVKHEIASIRALNEMFARGRLDGDEITRLAADGAPKPLRLVAMFREEVAKRDAMKGARR